MWVIRVCFFYIFGKVGSDRLVSVYIFSMGYRFEFMR